MLKIYSYLLAAAPIFAQQGVSPQINNFPSREFGQPKLLPSGLNSAAVNLVEGRELNAPFAIAFDTSANPPILYVVDTNNSRVLAWKNPNSLAPCGIWNASCGFADLVLGQRAGDFTATLTGGPSAFQTGFRGPTGIAVDSNGNVYVADSGNNRILRFPAPFKQTSALLQT